MRKTKLAIGSPFFDIQFLENIEIEPVDQRSIVLNLGETPIEIEDQQLPPLQSVIVNNTHLKNISRAVLVQEFDKPDDQRTMTEIRNTWPTAFQLRGEERLRGVEHYMSPKQWVGEVDEGLVGLTVYHSASVPLNVGLHKEHPFCPVPGFREVHTQLMGLGKMQQCREKDLATLYWEEVMAPGHTHKPMFDDQGVYPWHQFETITPSVFMAVEMLPVGVETPK